MHQTADFLHIHYDSHMQKPHIYSSYAFCITSISICFYYQLEVFQIGFFSDFSYRL